MEVWETEEILCGNQAEILTSRRAALAEGYMEDTQESRGRKIFREHSHDTGTFY